jgi:hypothetical protein
MQFLFFRSQENENSDESQGDTSSIENLYQQLFWLKWNGCIHKMKLILGTPIGMVAGLYMWYINIWSIFPTLFVLIN